MANIGDKFIIEIGGEFGPHSSCKEEFEKDHNKTLYRIKGFSALVFDNAGLKKLKKYDPEKEYVDAYNLGMREGYKVRDTDIKKQNELIDELKEVEYKKGFETGYNDGVEEAWDTLTRLIFELSEADARKVLDTKDSVMHVLKEGKVGPFDAIARMKDYDKKKQIKASERDLELDAFCDEHRGVPCENCIMRTVFTKCGEGFHISETKGRDNIAAHKLMEAERFLRKDGPIDAS